MDDEDDETFRRLQNEHFYSKDILPSTIPGQNEKCWDRCDEDQVSEKTKFGLDIQKREKTQRQMVYQKTEETKSKVEVSFRFSQPKSPMMLTAMLVPVEK